MRKEREHFTAEDTVAIPRRCLLEKVPVLELGESPGLRPTVSWHKEPFENGAAAFPARERGSHQPDERQKPLLGT